jgi:hypothetical protein
MPLQKKRHSNAKNIMFQKSSLKTIHEIEKLNQNKGGAFLREQ